ncbi:SCO6880 family protein [Streptodolium elevatio]|uniref:SCO6880 family protein n=1 Tax=Streptodolium elevatio TaxID=3157996 RepID=A0ABV3DEG3_9ACTN
MDSTPTTEPLGPRTYGNWRKPLSPGIGGIGAAGTLLLFTGMLLFIIVMFVSMVMAVGVAVVFGIALLPLVFRDKHGRNGLQRITARVAWIRGKLAGKHLFRSGPLSEIPSGTCELPGVGAASSVYASTDAHGRPFALVSFPGVGHHTVVLSCEADGASLVDGDQIDTWVGYWGQWLGQLGHEPGLVGASVTIEAAPDSGERLRREVTDNLAADAPTVAIDVLREVVRSYPKGSARLSTWVALTYSGVSRISGARMSVDEVAAGIGSRLPGLCDALQMTGAGPAQPMTSRELAEAVRVAYDPRAAATLERSHGEGEEIPWSETGPMSAVEAWDHYRHDSGWSVTWSMSEAPRGGVFSSILLRLVLPHADILRKRVTLVYRPHDPGTAARLVERDRKDALFKAKQAKIPNARDSVAVRAAEQAAHEEATGAGVVRFGMFVTATVDSAEALKLAASTVDSLASSSRVLLRRVFGAQATAFAATLPLGLVLPSHLHVPQKLRESI